MTKITRRILFWFIVGMIAIAACTLTPNPIPLDSTPPTSSTGEPTQRLPVSTPPPNGEPSPDSPTPATETATLIGVEPDQLTGVTLQFWHGFSGEREGMLVEWANTFNTSNTYGITIEITRQENLVNAVQEAIRANQPPNLTIAFANQAAAWDFAGAPPGNALVDLTPYLSDPVYGFPPEERTDFYPAFLDHETIDGKLTGLPTYRSAQVIFYNVSWAQELGFSAAPATPDEFKEQACAASQANGDGTGGWFINTDTAAVLGWIFAFGGQITGEDGYTFNTPETGAAFSFIQDLFASGCAWQPENFFPNAEFAARQGLFYASSLSGLSFQKDAFANAGNPDEWTLIPFPTPDGQPATHVFGPAYQIFTTTPTEQLAAWLFVQWASSPPNQAGWTNVSGYFPTRASTIQFLNEYVANTPQWTRAYDLVPIGKDEPTLPSWGTVRWVVSDAAAQLFLPGFSTEGIPALLEELELTANELRD